MTTISIIRTVSATPEEAFAAWTEPEQLAQWWWPQWPDTVYELDVHNGGAYSIWSDKMQLGVSGTFIQVDVPKSLAMTWIWNDGDGPAEAVDQVTVDFVAVAEGTEVTVRHESTEHLQDGGAEQGWNDCLDRLVSYFD